MRKILSCMALLLALSGCYNEEETIDGRWIGTISDETRKELRIEGKIDGDALVIQFEPSTIHMNDTVRDVEYSSNKGRTLVKFKNENRVMTIYHDEKDPTKIRLAAVSYIRSKVYNFDLERDGD